MQNRYGSFRLLQEIDMSNLSNLTAAIILAAGVGSRMGCEKTKQTIEIAGKSVLKHTVLAFDKAKSVDEIIVVCRKNETEFVNKELQNTKKKTSVIIGGKNRAESAIFGFRAISDDVKYVLIHDAARCLITPDEIDSVAEACYRFGAATASQEVSDTVKLCQDKKIIKTVPRRNLRLMQTPQAFSTEIYAKAIENAAALDETVTDDNMLVENIGISPYCVDTLPTNIKITTSYDLELAEFILSKRKGN